MNDLHHPIDVHRIPPIHHQPTYSIEIPISSPNTCPLNFTTPPLLLHHIVSFTPCRSPLAASELETANSGSETEPEPSNPAREAYYLDRMSVCQSTTGNTVFGPGVKLVRRNEGKVWACLGEEAKTKEKEGVRDKVGGRCDWERRERRRESQRLEKCMRLGKNNLAEGGQAGEKKQGEVVGMSGYDADLEEEGPVQQRDGAQKVGLRSFISQRNLPAEMSWIPTPNCETRGTRKG